MEALGGAAAITGLFQAVLASYSFWDQCRKYGSESNFFLNQLKLEEARLRLWGEKWDLELGSGQKFFEHFKDQPHVLAVVRQSLEQLKLLFEQAQKWGQRLEQAGTKKQGHAEAGEISARAGGVSLMSIFKSPSKRKSQCTSLAIDSVKWALPGGKEDFQKLIVNIRETTNTLCDITDHHVLEELISAVGFHKARSLEEACEIAEATADTKSLLHMVADMRAKVTEIDLIISNSPRYFESRRPKPDEDSIRRMDEWTKADKEMRARFDRWRKRMCKDFWESNAATNLPIIDFHLQQQYSHGREIAQYERSLILIRWVEDRNIFWEGGEGLSTTKTTEIQRMHIRCIAAVASQLHHIHHTQWKSGIEPKLIRTLDCVGYLYDELGAKQCDRFSYAFLLPSHLQTAEAVSCTSLRDCLLTLQEPPHLNIRKKLAKALSRTMFGIQLAGLLHKSFNPDNIIFLGRHNSVDDTKIIGLLGEPYVVGFDLARPLCEYNFSWVPVETDVYTHPAYHVMRHFIAAFDIHSLGLVLLSIGLWRPLESFWGEYLVYCDEQGRPRPQSNLDYQGLFSTAKENNHRGNFDFLKWSYVEFLLEQTENLSTSCSPRWADAVKWCTTTAQGVEYTEKDFLEKVVQIFDG